MHRHHKSTNRPPLYPELTARIPDDLPEELRDPDCWPEYVIGRIPDPPADPDGGLGEGGNRLDRTDTAC
jgi:hypothetical protein